MKIERLALAIAAACAIGTASARAGTPDDAAAQGRVRAEGAVQLRETLEATYPATRFGEVRPSVIEGLYEVELGKNLAYIEPSGRYFFFGHVYDMQRQVDLTADRKAAQAASGQRFALDGLDQDTFIARAAAPGKPTVTVFSDPLCGFCKSLEQTLALAPEIGVRIALLPYQPGAAGVAQRIWCAPDPGAAWNAYMLENIAPPLARPDCDTGAIARNAEVARRAGIAGTPTLVAPDGRMQAGAMDLAALNNWLDAAPPAADAAVITDLETSR